ncbi:MAG: cytidine deaminase [Candidatus Sumerlaeaceae bacterium]|nr:cytidine deaminase [Candidatus Sumerlaeaceae bacterium]
MNPLDDTRRLELLRAARLARAHAYAPYSRFRVGAAVLCGDGRIVPGCNVENSSFGLTVCAERVAIGAAIAQGATGFHAIAIAASPPAMPCGACRQTLVEFNPDMVVLIAGPDGDLDETREMRAADLLPDSFRFEP